MKRDSIRQLAVLLSTLVSVAGIYLINAGLTPLTSVTDIAYEDDRINPTLPADFIFGIWGVIYLGFLIYALFQALPGQRSNPVFRQTGYLAALSILLNLIWALLIGFELYVAPYLVQWGMLFVSLLLVKRWRKADPAAKGITGWLRIPFGIYAGWLTVAMIPFTTDLLQTAGWQGEPFGPVFWAIVLYFAAVAIGYLAFRYLEEPWYLFPIAWAMFGIAIRFSGAVPLVAGSLCVLVLLMMMGHLSGLLPAADRQAEPAAKGSPSPGSA